MNELLEQLKTIRNLCDIAILLEEKGELNQRAVLMPTILELLHIETAKAVEEHCIVDEHKS